MKPNRALPRITAMFLLVAALVGTVEPLQAVDAAGNGQIGGEGWTEGKVPPPVPVTLNMTSAPTTQPSLQDQKQIQTRRPGPITPEGTTTGILDNEPESAETMGDSIVAAAAPGSFSVFANKALGSAPSALEVNSPSVANNGRDIFVSYNDYAALSKDYGATWNYIDPDTLSTSPAHGALVGNQDVFYDSSRNLLVWVVQFEPDSTSGNSLALVVAKGRFQLESNSWVAYSIGSTSLSCGGNNPDTHFDRPQLTRTNNYLYIAANVYYNAGPFLCTTMLRLSLKELAAQGGLSLSTYYSQVGFNFTPAQGGTTTLYFARHKSTTQLAVYTWPESAGASGVTATIVSHAGYLRTGYHCPITASTDPCAGDDDRLTTGWLKGGKWLGFMWDAAQNGGTRPYPFTRVLVLNPSTKAVVSRTDIWNSSFAWFMPSSSVNARGHVGGTIASAGGSTKPSCSTWLNDDISNMPAFAHVKVAASDAAPTANAWGDYLQTRRSGLNPFQWVGTCYALQSGHVIPHVVRFGRERDRYSRMKGDFNVDGRSDIAIFRPSSGLWAVRSQFSLTAYGQFGDIPVPGDYDGDGRADVAFFRPATGTWWIRGSASVPYGQAGDVPVPADYNGDGTTDLAFFRPATGKWNVKNQFSLFFGRKGDIPVPGDYTGDGRADVAVFRPANGTWYIKGQSPVIFGTKGDIPVPGDYNGDGRTDLAFFRPSNSTWHIKGRATFALGNPGDIPVPGDYNGDGKTDAAIFRPSTGQWKTRGGSTITFGKKGDFPLLARDTNGDGDPYQ